MSVGFEPIKFLKGLNQKPDPEITDGLVECVGLDFGKIGSVRSKLDHSVFFNYGTDILYAGFGEVHSLFYFKNTNYSALINAMGAGVFLGEGQLLSGNFVATPRLDFTTYATQLFFTNTTYGVWIFDDVTPLYLGTLLVSGPPFNLSLFRAGTPIPSATHTIATGVGSFNGTYNIKVTFGNYSGFDGNPSTAVSTGALASNSITVNGINISLNISYPNVVRRKVWIQGGDNPYYSEYVLLATIEDNVTTTTGALDTTAVDATTLLEDDNDTPPNFEFIEEHYGVGFGAGHNRNSVRFSKVGSLHQWPTANEFVVSNSNDPIMKLTKWNDAFWVISRASIFEIIGSPGSGILSTNFFPKRTQAVEGTNSSRSVVPTPYGLFYMANDGIRKFNGQVSSVFSNEVEDEISQITVPSLTCGIFFDDKLFMSFVTGSNTTPNKTVIYDFKREVWDSEDWGFVHAAVDDVNDVLYFSSGQIIYKYQKESTYRAWSLKTKNLVTKLDAYGVWGKFQIDFVGSLTAQVYLDEVLSGSYPLTNTNRNFSVCRFPLGISKRAAIRLVGSGGSIQDIVYGIGYSGELQREQV